jgi:hypothetical protein
MRLTSLALLLTGAVSSASATPDKTESTDRVSYKGDTRRAAPGPESSADGWIELASPTPASHGREFIAVDPKATAFVRLKIAAVSGRPKIEFVRVIFADGTQRVVRLDRIVSKQRAAFVDLKGARKIDRLVVDTRGSKKSTYVIHGEADKASIATR